VRPATAFHGVEIDAVLSRFAAGLTPNAPEAAASSLGAMTFGLAISAFKREDRNGRIARWESLSFGQDVAHQPFHAETRADFSDVIQDSSAGRRNLERPPFSGDLENRLSSRVHGHGHDWLRRDPGSYSKKFMNGIYDLLPAAAHSAFQSGRESHKLFGALTVLIGASG